MNIATIWKRGSFAQLQIKSEVRCIIMLRFLNGSKIEIPKLVNNEIKTNEVSNIVAQIRARLLLLQALEN